MRIKIINSHFSTNEQIVSSRNEYKMISRLKIINIFVCDCKKKVVSLKTLYLTMK